MTKLNNQANKNTFCPLFYCTTFAWVWLLYATDLEHGTFDPTDKLLEGLRGKLGI